MTRELKSYPLSTTELGWAIGGAWPSSNPAPPLIPTFKGGMKFRAMKRIRTYDAWWYDFIIPAGAVFYAIHTKNHEGYVVRCGKDVRYMKSGQLSYVLVELRDHYVRG